MINWLVFNETLTQNGQFVSIAGEGKHPIYLRHDVQAIADN